MPNLVISAVDYITITRWPPSDLVGSRSFVSTFCFFVPSDN